MIVVAGLTPAWQTVMRFDRFAAGEVNRAKEVHHFASGKVLNVAVALAHLGVSCKTITVVGGTPRGMIDQEFSVLGIARHWILSRAVTRSCVTVLDDTTRTTTELVENACPLAAEELEEFAAVFAHDVESATAVVLTGSLPDGTPSSYYKDLMSDVRCPVILDARGPELLAALEKRPWLVKPNREELAATMRRSLETDEDLHAAMHKLVDLGAQRVFVSHGAQPAWFLDGGNFYRFTSPTVDQVINPIGSGDCLAAGVAVALGKGRSPVECIAYGMAAAAENVTQLYIGRIEPDTVEKRAAQVGVYTKST